MEFHETRYGNIFFSAQLPKLIKGIERIGDELKRANDIREAELKAKGMKGESL